MATTAGVPAIRLNNGVEIPQLGFGVFKVDPRHTREAVLVALEAGYRHIDTAQMYGNETGVGAAIRESGLERTDVFVTSKLNNGFHAYEDALRAFDRTIETLGLGYVDLFLIHWPMPKVGNYVETWRAMEEMLRGGRTRAIGVSNFQVHHLARLAHETTTVPAVNQIEVHPYLTNEVVRTYNTEHGILTEAWSPLARGAIAADPVINRIATRLDRTPAQVTVRWHLQRGDVVIPKSVTPSRVRENIAVFDFALGEDDMAAISALNRNQRTGPDPDAFQRIS